MRYTASVIVLFSISLLATAHDHGSTSDDSSSSSMDGHMMVPYLHTTPGDALFFKGWIPRSSGAIGGACVGLFLLAILERWVNAMNGVAASSWARSAQIKRSNELNAAAAGSTRRNRISVPFIFAHDIPRGVIHAVQRTLSYALMLAVMTFQVGFIIAIIVGGGVGEILFGRYAHGGAVH